MRFQVIVATSIVLSTSAVSNRAAAGGLEYPGAGAQGLGRAGAVIAKADDPMVLGLNPAGLAELRGNQMMLDISLAFMDACVEPIGYYGWGAYGGGTPSRIPDPAGGPPTMLNLGGSMVGPAETAYYNGRLDTVCMQQNILPVPQVGLTSRLNEDLGVGIGLMFPPVTPQGKWGDSNGVIVGAEGLRPAATRYMMINSGTIAIFPTAGFGFRLTDWLRLGASFEWGIFSINNLSMAAVSAGTTPSADILADVRAEDWFVPALNASIHLVPFDSLDIVAMFRWQDSLKAAGHIDLKTNVFEPRGNPRTTRNVVDAVKMNFPMKLAGAIRYAHRLAPRPTGDGHAENTDTNRDVVRDPFSNELWDLELDVEYIISSNNKEQVIDYAENQSVVFEPMVGMLNMAKFPDATRVGQTTDTVIGKHWKNQLSFRLGGSWNIVPGVFGISLGGSHETRGIDPAFMQIDYWPVSRTGLHAGVKFRVSGKIDVVASYAHFFQETIVAGAPAHEVGETSYPRYSETGEVTTIDKRVGVVARGMENPPLEEAPVTGEDAKAALTQNVTKLSAGRVPWIVNSGTYRSGLDVVAIGVNVHF